MIRRLGLADRSEFRALRQAALEANPEAYATSAEDWRNAPDEKIDALLQGSVDGTLPILGCFAPDLVGMIGLRPESDPATHHKAMLWGLFVPPDRRRQGVGQRLMEAVLGEAQATPHLTMLTLVVAAENAAALRLFERHGFQSYGTEPRARKVAGACFDQIFLYRFLRD